MAFLLLVLSGVLVVAIAVYAVSRTSSRLSRTEAVSVFDLAEAVDWVAERLPASLAEQLSPETVELLLSWQLDFLRQHGVASFGIADTMAKEAASRPRGTKVAFSEDDLAVAVLAKAWQNDLDISEVDVVVVLDTCTGYLRAIGAIGDPQAGFPK